MSECLGTALQARSVARERGASLATCLAAIAALGFAVLVYDKRSAVSNQLAPRMKKGYECSYLGDLKQQGFHVLLWKLMFKDGGDDTLAKLALKDGKVAGFWLQ